MRKIPDHVRALVQRLYHEHCKSESIIEIQKAGDWRTVPDLLRFVFSEHSVAAMAAVEALMAKVPPSQFPLLEDLIRQIDYFYRGDPWFSHKPEIVKEISALPGNTTVFLGLATFNTSGYVRQAAIEQLASCRTGEELPFLILRTNDWVEQVRALAYALVEKRLTPSYAGHFARNLALIERLTICSRANHSGLVARVKNLLQRPECAEQLFSGTESADLANRRVCFRWALEQGSNASLSMIKRAMCDKDVVVSMAAARAIRLLPDSAERQELLQGLRWHSLHAVRREYLYALATTRTPDALVELKQFLLDDSRSLREAARFYLAWQAPLDFNVFYKQALAQAGEFPPPAALLGIGETGAKQDAALLLPYLEKHSVAIVKSALRALNKLDGERYVSTFLEYLTHPQPGLTKEVADALLDKAALIPSETLWKIVSLDNPPHARLNALKLIYAKDQWENLPYLIHACSLPDEQVSNKAQDYLSQWLRRYKYTFVPTNANQIKRVKDALLLNKNVLPQATVECLNWIMKDFEKGK